jgi:hypothetical protein
MYLPGKFLASARGKPLRVVKPQNEGVERQGDRRDRQRTGDRAATDFIDTYNTGSSARLTLLLIKRADALRLIFE